MTHFSLVHYLAQIDVSPLPNQGGGDVAKSSVATALGIIFPILGAVALLVVVIAGLRYILAGGDPSQVAQAKKAIIYALVGLAIALSGYSIVTFVIKGVG